MAGARPAAAAAALLAAAGCAGCLGGGSDEPSGRAGRSIAAGGARSPAPREGERWPDRARYDLSLRYDASRFSLAGSERIAFANTGPQPLESVWLRTWANAYGSCARPRAEVRVAAGGSAGARREGCTALEVRLPEPLAPGRRAQIALAVRVTVPPRPDRFGRIGRIASFGNGLPILAVADRSGWHLPPYTDRGESFFSLTSEWHVDLRLPAELAVASTGTERARGKAGADRRAVLTAPHARDFTLVIGRMAMRRTRAGDVTIRRFTEPSAPPRRLEAALRTARAALLAYERRFGPYLAPELDVVQGPAEVARGGLAMEYPELVLTPAFPPALVHEVAHQWWMGIVGNDQWSEPWLDEAFAEYSAASLPRRIGGPDRLYLCRQARRDPLPLSAGMELFARRPPKLYSRSIYVAGACALRQLERGLGRARMDRFLRGLVDSHRFGVLTTAGFVDALRAAAPAAFDVDGWLERARIQTG